MLDRLFPFRRRIRELEAQLEQVGRETEQLLRERDYQELVTMRELMNGTFYSTVDQVWGAKAETFGSDNLKALRRMVPPAFVHPFDRAPSESSAEAFSFKSGKPLKRGIASGAHLDATYTWIVECARESLFGVAPDASDDSHTSSTKLDLWPVDIFGGPPVPSTEISHLLPAERMLSELYVDVAICALAMEDKDGWEVLKKAIHGCTDTENANKRKRESSHVGASIEMGGSEIRGTAEEDGPGIAKSNAKEAVDEKKEKEQGHTEATGTVAHVSQNAVPQRVRHTGIKHSVCNKIRLAAPKAFFDTNPGVLIVPVMDLGEMKRWNGEGYRAIVMVKDLGGANTPGVICCAIHMIHATPGADPADIEKARKLLSDVVKGLAYSLLHRFHGESAMEHELDERQLGGQLSDLRTNFANRGGGGVIVPVPKMLDPGQATPRVRIVTFGSAWAASVDDTGNALHPAPDPLLLAVRAAVNWSAQNNQRLLLSAEPEVFSDSEDDYLDRMAEEDYLQWRDAARRNPSWEELGRRLGQPHGHNGDDDDNDASTTPSQLSDPFDEEDFDRLSEG